MNEPSDSKKYARNEEIVSGGTHDGNEIGFDALAQSQRDFEAEGEAVLRAERLRESLECLKDFEPPLLRGLEEARVGRVPLGVHVAGYEHNSKIILALLRCSHAYGVTLVLVPFPLQRIGDLPVTSEDK